MKVSAATLVLACAVVGGAVWFARDRQIDSVMTRVGTLENEVAVQRDRLLGYDRYTSYLTLGKQSLAEQMKLLTATVVRDESVTQVLERSVLGFQSTGTVVVWHSVEYAFGFDLRPGHYEIVPTATGIDVRVDLPTLVTQPAVTDLHFKVLSGGLFTDERGAVLKLYEEAARRAKTQGEAMARDPATIALCEKKLIGFLRDFLQAQPGVRFVPTIRVVYR